MNNKESIRLKQDSGDLCFECGGPLVPPNVKLPQSCYVVCGKCVEARRKKYHSKYGKKE